MSFRVHGGAAPWDSEYGLRSRSPKEPKRKVANSVEEALEDYMRAITKEAFPQRGLIPKGQRLISVLRTDPGVPSKDDS